MEVKSEEKQMKYVIGDINKFAIQYILMPNPYDERGVIGQSWGRLDLWVSGKNLCQYKVGDTVNVYIWNLFYVIEWFCENLHHILGYDPFPLPVKGENTLELIQKADTFDIDEEDENYLWHHAKRTWIFRHTWFPNRGGSRLPSVYFRRVGENIEIAWNNNFYEKKYRICSFQRSRGYT